ncbi:hypothetical protein GGI23_005678 [Coemansia sp. RSA 2559]|nr:hypothetical protein GGI23_005678 [Coemansia sp. RSA 2559]
MDMERYPTAEGRHHFLRSDVCTKALIDAAMKAELAQPTERWICKKVAELDREVSVFVAASHLHWGVQALLKACFAEIDFDYVSYSAQRKSIFLS